MEEIEKREKIMRRHMDIGKSHRSKAGMHVFGYNTVGKIFFFIPQVKKFFIEKSNSHNRIAQAHFHELEKLGNEVKGE